MEILKTLTDQQLMEIYTLAVYEIRDKRIEDKTDIVRAWLSAINSILKLETFYAKNS